MKQHGQFTVTIYERHYSKPIRKLGPAEFIALNEQEAKCLAFQRLDKREHIEKPENLFYKVDQTVRFHPSVYVPVA